MSGVGRFAPSTTGPAHPGTLLAALLCWLDARSRGMRLVLRLEDLDPERCRPEWREAMPRDLAWLGLDWDAIEHQSANGERHAAALDRLAAEGRLYPCACSRRALAAAGERAPDGGWRYAGTCRERALPTGGWRASGEALRVRLPRGRVAAHDESGRDLSRDVAASFGDPVVRRRDGAVAYGLAAVVDDAAADVTRVVRGRDLAETTPVQNALRQLLALPVPVHRHHLLLLEPRGEKLAKFHGAVGAPELRRHLDAPALCGLLAEACGLAEPGTRRTPADLLAGFDWARVAEADRVARWTGDRLLLDPSAPA